MAYDSGNYDMTPKLQLNQDIQFDFLFQIYSHQINDAYVRLVKARVAENLTEAKSVSWREVRVLLTLIFIDDALSPKQLSDVIRCDPATATRSIANLKRDGFVESRANPDDTRSKLVSLTPEGRTLAETYHSQVTQVFSQINEELGFDMSAQEQAAALALLKKFRNGLYKISESPVHLET